MTGPSVYDELAAKRPARQWDHDDPAQEQPHTYPSIRDDEDACTADSCDPQTGECLHEAIACNDEDP